MLYVFNISVILISDCRCINKVIHISVKAPLCRGVAGIKLLTRTCIVTMFGKIVEDMEVVLDE
jgi:hypothetical protein